MKDVFRWEQDPSGGDNGMATFCLGEDEVSVRMYSFREAHELSLAVSAAIREARYEGRVSMLNEVARTRP